MRGTNRSGLARRNHRKADDGLREAGEKSRCCRIHRRADPDQIGGVEPLGALQHQWNGPARDKTKRGEDDRDVDQAEGVRERRQQHPDQDHPEQADPDQRDVERRRGAVSRMTEKDRTCCIADHEGEQGRGCGRRRDAEEMRYHRNAPHAGQRGHNGEVGRECHGAAPVGDIGQRLPRGGENASQRLVALRRRIRFERELGEDQID